MQDLTWARLIRMAASDADMKGGQGHAPDTGRPGAGRKRGCHRGLWATAQVKDQAQGTPPGTIGLRWMAGLLARGSGAYASVLPRHEGPVENAGKTFRSQLRGQPRLWAL